MVRWKSIGKIFLIIVFCLSIIIVYLELSFPKIHTCSGVWYEISYLEDRETENVTIVDYDPWYSYICFFFQGLNVNYSYTFENRNFLLNPMRWNKTDMFYLQDLSWLNLDRSDIYFYRVETISPKMMKFHSVALIEIH